MYFRLALIRLNAKELWKLAGRDTEGIENNSSRCLLDSD